MLVLYLFTVRDDIGNELFQYMVKLMFHPGQE